MSEQTQKTTAAERAAQAAEKRAETRSEARVLVTILHSSPGKDRKDWPVKKQYVATYDEYLALDTEALAHSKVRFIGPDEKPDEFDHSEKFPEVKPRKRRPDFKGHPPNSPQMTEEQIAAAKAAED